MLFSLGLAALSLFLIFGIVNYALKLYYASKGATFVGSITLQMFVNAVRGSSRIDQYDSVYKAIREDGRTDGKIGVGEELGIKTYFLRDPELIKYVLVKDFWNFPDRRELIFTERDYLVTKMLVLLTKDRWRVTRPKFAPMFTASNIRKAFPLVDVSSDKLVEYLVAKSKSCGSKEIVLDLADPCYKYALDISASVSGLESIDVFSKSGGRIEDMARALTVIFSVTAFLNLLFIRWLPKLANWLNVSATDPKSLEYFGLLFKDSISKREREGENEKLDFLNYIVALRKFPKTEDGLDGFDDKDIEACLMQLFFGGLDSGNGVMIFFLYHLACNPEIQDKLRAEVDENWEKNEGKLSQDTIKGMIYLDMAFKEVLRMHPPIWDMDRTCRAEEGVPLPGTGLVIQPGDLLVVSIHALHNDPQYFPEPHRFIPERFTKENFEKIPPYAYIPFAAGPKRCIAVDFAPFQMKTAVAKIIRAFRLEITKDTQIPVKYKDGIVLAPKNTLPLKFIRLDKS